jgi:hypothetical protein
MGCPGLNVPADERDVSKHIKELLAADRSVLSDSFATDLEESGFGVICFGARGS